MKKVFIFGIILLAIWLFLVAAHFSVIHVPYLSCDSKAWVCYSIRMGGKGSYVSLSNGKIIKIIATARTEQDRAKGLSGRGKIKSSEGMWFEFDQPGYYPFWMKDMKFAIDIIFLDKNYKVTDIFQNVPAPISKTSELPTYQNTSPAQYVLEVSAGVSVGVAVGDKVSILNRNI